MRSPALPAAAAGCPVRSGLCTPPSELVVSVAEETAMGDPLWNETMPLALHPPASAFSAPLLLRSFLPAPNGRSYSKLVTSRCGVSMVDSDLSRNRLLLLVKPGFCWPRKPATDEKSSSIFDQV